MSTYQAARESEIFDKQRTILDACKVQSPLVFDVGANAGQSIERYRQLFPGCRLHSFEPIPGLAEDLERRFSGVPGISIHRFAIGDVAGEVPLNVTRREEMSSLLQPEPWLAALSPDRKYDFSTIAVPAGTLDGFCEAAPVERIDVLKIDVQGAELRVLKGCKRMLSEGRVGLIYLEANLADTYVGQARFSELLGFLEPLGYQLWDVLPFVFTGAGRAWAANALFVCPEWVRITESAFRHRTE